MYNFSEVFMNMDWH